ncbi:hypothetical protein BB560_001097, partial [Smittium megazygosporum]
MITRFGISAHPELSDDELDFLNIFIKSPKACKSSVVWYHREWVFKNVLQIDNWFLKQNSTSLLSRYFSEHTLISSSNILHERNYTALKYKSWLFLKFAPFFIEQALPYFQNQICPSNTISSVFEDDCYRFWNSEFAFIKNSSISDT